MRITKVPTKFKPFIKEADKILYSANWVKRKLSKALGKPGKDYEKVFNL